MAPSGSCRGRQRRRCRTGRWTPGAALLATECDRSSWTTPGGPGHTAGQRAVFLPGQAQPGPGCIVVNRTGQRFVSESAPCIDAMYDDHGPGSPPIPPWLITGRRYRNRYVFAGLTPRRPLPRRWRRAGGVHRGVGYRRAGPPGRCGPGRPDPDGRQVQRVRRGRPGRELRPQCLRLRPTRVAGCPAPRTRCSVAWGARSGRLSMSAAAWSANLRASSGQPGMSKRLTAAQTRASRPIPQLATGRPLPAPKTTI
jgi:hypothetical protein